MIRGKGDGISYTRPEQRGRFFTVYGVLRGRGRQQVCQGPEVDRPEPVADQRQKCLAASLDLADVAEKAFCRGAVPSVDGAGGGNAGSALGRARARASTAMHAAPAVSHRGALAGASRSGFGAAAGGCVGVAPRVAVAEGAGAARRGLTVHGVQRRRPDHVVRAEQGVDHWESRAGAGRTGTQQGGGIAWLLVQRGGRQQVPRSCFTVHRVLPRERVWEGVEEGGDVAGGGAVFVHAAFCTGTAISRQALVAA